MPRLFLILKVFQQLKYIQFSETARLFICQNNLLCEKSGYQGKETKKPNSYTQLARRLASAL